MRVVLIGGGGHASVVLDAARTMPELDIVGVIDTDTSKHGGELLGCPILGGDEFLSNVQANGFLMGIGSIGNPAVREAAFDRAVASGLIPINVVHVRAWVSPDATVGPGTVVLANATINAGARIGGNVILNTGCIIEHDATVDDLAHIAPGAVVLGSTRVGAGTHVGAGAVVREGIIIGSAVLIAAGAVVVGDVPNGRRMAGVPARDLDLRTSP